VKFEISSAVFRKSLIAVIFFAVMSSQAYAHGTHSSLMAKVDAQLAERPEDGGLWYQRAVLEFEHEDFAAAAEDFAKAEKFAPGEYAVLWWQGRIFDATGKTNEAKAAMDLYLAKKPDHWGALATRARVLTKLGTAEAALADFRASLANCPDAQPDLVQEVAQAFASHGRVDEAVGFLENGLKRIGQVPSLQLKLLEIEVQAGRYDSALSRIGGFQSGAARSEPWMEKRAIILAQAGKTAESQTAWHTLIRHVKSLPPAERDSHSMTLLAERARQALAVLATVKSPVSVFSPPP
jgi:tetratricopeptide (TPR) repeat protein